jgi:selenocysteine-specific elongation factor
MGTDGTERDGVLHYIMATAGHVDHGKSALVKALTGTDPDRLPEEKARGLTIDLGFAGLDLANGDSRYHLGIVDVPGHEDFVKNMVAGVGSIDLALLVVAADDGWMPQTEEHLQILTYLGVKRAVVALTKVDLMPESELAAEEVREQLMGTPLEDAPVIETSSIQGLGLDALRSALTDVLRDTPLPRDIGKPRLPVDRVFSMPGAGTIVTGTLAGGSFEAGQAVVLQPSGIDARIRRIQSHHAETDRVSPGTRVALNLPNVEAGEAVSRGHVVTAGVKGRASLTIDAILCRSGRDAGRSGESVKPLKDETRLRFHCASTTVPARIHFLSPASLEPGGTAIVQIRTEEPVYVFAGDRFVLRDWPERRTLAGGRVLDPCAQRARLHRSDRLDFLEARARDDADGRVFLQSALVRNGVVNGDEAILQSRFDHAELREAAATLMRDGVIIEHAPWYIHKAAWRKAARLAAATIEEHHAANPETMGYSLAALRSAVQAELPDEALFPFLVDDLCQLGFEQTAALIRKSAHQAELPEHLRQRADTIRKALNNKPLEPPARKELVQDKTDEQVMRFLLDADEAVKIGQDLIFSKQGFDRARQAVGAFIQQNGPATVSELREALGTTRRIMVPLLEKFDHDGITVRSGDKRRLGQA